VGVTWRRCKVVMMTMKPSFTEALGAFEFMRGLMYAHITKRDQANIVNKFIVQFEMVRFY
jgi:hypothetical protein